MSSRRNFIKSTSLTALSTMLLSDTFSKGISNKFSNHLKNNDKIWAFLLHLSFNMWGDERDEKHPQKNVAISGYLPHLNLDEDVWEHSLKCAVQQGLNMVVIDLGDAVLYKSHPEISVKNAWKRQKLAEQLIKIRKMGLEPIPKLNFSTGHDVWLGKYSRMVSTPAYYKVCADLIHEVIDIFNKPRFFHIGMDEETAYAQRRYNYVVIRQNDLWWKDLFFYCEHIEKRGVRPWMWSDYIWNHPEDFLKRMPKSIVQSNWYYFDEFENPNDMFKNYLSGYAKLNEYGYDQIPTSAYMSYGEPKFVVNTMRSTQYCTKLIADDKLMGFLQTTWMPTLKEFKQPIEKALHLMGDAKKWYITNKK